jgi:hypothetical protein
MRKTPFIAKPMSLNGSRMSQPIKRTDKIIPNVIMAHLLYEDNYILFHIFVTDYFCKIGEVAINLATFLVFNQFFTLTDIGLFRLFD